MNNEYADIGVSHGHGLTRRDCPRCGPECLHKHGRCIHCGRSATAVRVKVRRRAFVINPRKAQAGRKPRTVAS
jgi:uncharacterized OB-fold protein